MDKQKVVMVLLVIAIALSAVNLFVSASFDTGALAEPAADTVAQPDVLETSGVGRVGFTVTEGTG